MAKPSRRIHARYPCDLPVEIFSPLSSKKLADARMLDLSMGGASIEVSLNLQKGVPYELRFVWENQTVQLISRIAWQAPSNLKRPKERRYGISFNLSIKQEAPLKQLLDRLRQDHWPSQPDVVRDYWSV